MQIFNKNTDTDADWEHFGKSDPYFNVLTFDKFRKSNMTDEDKEEFFRTGYNYIGDILATIRKRIDHTFTINKALDFGCGVGRLVIPLASVAQQVIGVDVSDSMLNEAKKNCEERSIKNVFFIKSDDNLSLLKDKYDFIHSFLVFLHIPVKRGEQLFKNLMAHLENDGVCVVHFLYADPNTNSSNRSLIQKLVASVKKHIPLASNFINLVRGRGWYIPPMMQVNTYNINRLFLIMQKANILEFHTTFTNHLGGYSGIIIYFRKPKGEYSVGLSY